MYEMDRDELLLVDTIDKVSRWEISIYGFDPILELSRNQIVQSCLNFQSWIYDQPSVIGQDQLDSYSRQDEVDIYGLYSEAEDGFTKVYTGGMADKYCLVEASLSNFWKEVAICSIDEFTRIHYGSCPSAPMWMPSYQSLLPHTKIETLH